MTDDGSDSVFDRGPTHELADGRVVYRASSLGFCPGALVRSRLGVTPSPPPDNIQRAYDAGHANEDALIARGLAIANCTDIQMPDHLTRYGTIVEQQGSERLQIEVEVECGERALVRCHPDGIAASRDDLGMHVVEAKLLSAEYYDQIARNGLTDTYRWQAGVERAGTGLPILYIIGVKAEDGSWDAETGKVVVWSEVDRAFGAGVKKAHHHLTGLPDALDIKMRVWQIEGYVARGEIPACPLPLMWPCPWWKEHDEAEQVETVEDELLESLATRYADLGVQIKALEGQRKEAAQGILGWWDTADRSEQAVKVGRCRVTRVVAEKGNVSWKAVAEKYAGDLSDDELEMFRGKPNAPSVRAEMEE